MTQFELWLYRFTVEFRPTMTFGDRWRQIRDEKSIRMIKQTYFFSYLNEKFQNKQNATENDLSIFFLYFILFVVFA